MRSRRRQVCSESGLTGSMQVSCLTNLRNEGECDRTPVERTPNAARESGPDGCCERLSMAFTLARLCRRRYARHRAVRLCSFYGGTARLRKECRAMEGNLKMNAQRACCLPFIFT